MLQDILIKDGELLIAIQEALVDDRVTQIVTFITHLGNKGYLWIALGVLFLFFKKTRRAGVISLVSLALTFLVVNLFLKDFVARTRPYEELEAVRLLIEAQHDYSFPSGHAANSIAPALAMFLNLPKKLGVPILLLAIAIALSRLYVGVHYPLDVLGGIVIGGAMAFLVNTIANRIQDSRYPGKH